MKFIRPLLLCIAWFIEIFATVRWFGCWLFKENFYFTPQVLTPKLINNINADQGMAVIIVRLIHNKVFELLWGLLQALLQYWDIRFLEEFIGLIGAIGVGLGVWYFVTRDRKSIFLWVLFSLGIILPVINAFFQIHIEYKILIIVFGLLFQSISLYGLWKFLEKRTTIRYGFVFLLFVVSIVFLWLFPLFYQNFCIKV